MPARLGAKSPWIRWQKPEAEGNGVAARRGGREPEAKPRPEGHEPHRRRGGRGEPEWSGEARAIKGPRRKCGCGGPIRYAILGTRPDRFARDFRHQRRLNGAGSSGLGNLLPPLPQSGGFEGRLLVDIGTHSNDLPVANGEHHPVGR